MSYLLSSLKQAENKRKQNLCQDQDNLEQDDIKINQSSPSSALTSSTSPVESMDPPVENLFLENSSNQFSTKKNLTYVFFVSGISFVAIVLLIWFYMEKKPIQDKPLVPYTSELSLPIQDNLKLKLETELLYPTPAPSNKQEKTTASKK
jgi:magnesium-transporting ATPase (P-type)